MFFVFSLISFVRIKKGTNNYGLLGFWNRWYNITSKDAVTTTCCVDYGKDRNCMNQTNLSDISIDNIVFSTADVLDDNVCYVYHRVKNNNHYSKSISLAERFKVQIGDGKKTVSDAKKTKDKNGVQIGSGNETYYLRFKKHPHLIDASTTFVGSVKTYIAKMWDEGGAPEKDAGLCWSWKKVVIGPNQELNLSYFIYPKNTTLPLVLVMSNDVEFVPDSDSLTIKGSAFDPNGDFQPGMKLLMSVNGSSYKPVKSDFAKGVNAFQFKINMLEYPIFKIDKNKSISLVFYLEASSRKNSKSETITLFFENITVNSTNGKNSFSDKSLYCTNCNKQSNCPSTCPRCAICPKCKNNMLEDTDKEIEEIAKRYYKKYIRGEFEEEFRKNFENNDIDYEKGMYFIPIIET